MIPVKEILNKQWDEFCEMVKEFAAKDSDSNDEDYNYGRHEILRSRRIDFSDPDVNYYCECNNLSIRDIPGGIDDILRMAKFQ